MPDKWYARNVDDRDALKKGGFNPPFCIAPAFVGNESDWVLEFYGGLRDTIPRYPTLSRFRHRPKYSEIMTTTFHSKLVFGTRAPPSSQPLDPSRIGTNGRRRSPTPLPQNARPDRSGGSHNRNRLHWERMGERDFNCYTICPSRSHPVWL
jgi:hypothetical protein